MVYEKYLGDEVCVTIENDKNNPYTKIGDKAFLSCKNITEVRLPDTITEIGSWAFSHMKSLTKLYIPANDITLGKDVFLDCPKLREIVIYPGNDSGVYELFAAAQVKMNCRDLFLPKLAMRINDDINGETFTNTDGTTTKQKYSIDWLSLFDEELLKFIRLPDETGFKGVLIGWFNDEGEEEQLEKYKRERQELKVELCFLRLINDGGLGEKFRDVIYDYLMIYIDECLECTDNQSNNNQNYDNQRHDNRENVLVEYLIKHIGSNLDLAKCVVETGIFDSKFIELLIEKIESMNPETEVMSYLLSGLTHDDSKDAFEMFDI